ncbi:MAG TPA: ABC transporter substrate-binding protein, partial [Azospira sp.]|nr:ABC transporter substrate-binding protein [Azospira sp.]
MARRLLPALLLFCLALATSAPARAAHLAVGLAADVSSLDPHYLNAAPNIAVASHFFETLVAVDKDGQLVPGLAQSWQAINPTTWEFKLRPGVKFHDDSPLTTEDVVFSLERPASLSQSPGPFTGFTKAISGKKVVDAHTLRLTTAQPYGPLPLDLASIFIVSKKAAAKATTEDFNSGKALVGTGPFRLLKFRRGEAVELARFDGYWGESLNQRPAWDTVTLRILPADAARLAALLTGQVDMIEG